MNLVASHGITYSCAHRHYPVLADAVLELGPSLSDCSSFIFLAWWCSYLSSNVSVWEVVCLVLVTYSKSPIPV